MITKTVVRTVCLMLAWCSSVGHSQLSLETGPDADVTGDGLRRVDRSIMDSAWVKPDVDLTQYKKYLLWAIDVSFRDVDEVSLLGEGYIRDFPINDETQGNIRAYFREAFVDEMARVEGYELTNQPGRDVLMIEAYVADIVSHVPPRQVGVDGYTMRGLLDGTIVLQLVDSMSDEILVRTAVRQVSENLFNDETVWAETRHVLNRWAFLMRSQLDEIAELSSNR